MPRLDPFSASLRFSLLAFFLLLTACSETEQVVPPPPDVIVRTLQGQTTPISADIVAEIKAFRQVELRPRVSGIVTTQAFQPGQAVKEGDLLFSIDPRPYDEAVLNARAALAEAEAKLAQARQDVSRYRPLLSDNAIPRQTYDQATANAAQSAAAVSARKAQVGQAELDRSFCEVRSPVSGLIGLQQVEVGALASAGQTILATVSTLDPVLAYFSISEAEYLIFARRAIATGDTENKIPLQLILADGGVYPENGKLDFADRAIDASTGTLTLRAVFPNPSHLLRPGLSARIRVVYEVQENAILVPQKAVTELLGKRFVTVINAQNIAEPRAITTGARIGDLWLVPEGLKAGERVVIEGVQKARPGVTVNPNNETPALPPKATTAADNKK